MIMTDAVIYRAMETLKPQPIPGSRQRLLRNASITRIAQATAAFDSAPDKRPMPRRTVAHRLQAMARKGIIGHYGSALRNSPFGMSWTFSPLR